ncbi:MAG: hypothetical protein HDR83_05540 [Bacteroides sp.]|nr:hypothetical protein [Bacteroidales bacterium]MBD5250056.1 hypothetical protein [Barnesiella sp.]MBD5368701.1 hypothetical protein [Bacteroides sp.]
MKKILLIVLLGICFSLYGQIDAYNDKAAQKAVEKAYSLIKETYKDNDICVSDSVYDLDWDYFDVDSDINRSLDVYRAIKHYTWSKPQYSDALNKIFVRDTCNTPKYIALFSEPYDRMIRCDLLPSDLKIGILGTPVIPVLLFIYNEIGDIKQFYQGELNVE